MKMHTCQSLEHDGLWRISDCCQECHTRGETLHMGMDTYNWLNDEEAELCCASYWWFYGLRHDPYAKDVSDYLYQADHRQGEVCTLDTKGV